MAEDSYPVSIFCIIATEFCERFSFCGLRTILSLYLRNELIFPENNATVIYHVFIMVCYMIPVLGAICADSILGRYRTILYFSLIYLFGNTLMSLAAVPPLSLPPITCTFIGLALIAVGTGGIKPCVAAFGGDQFHLPNQQPLLQQFFSIFYFTINLGGFVGMILTPILRKGFACYGGETCYALGFGFPAILMLIAILLFVTGKPWYRLKVPKENVILKFIGCTVYAIGQKFRKDRISVSHWLDRSEGKYTKKLIHDMKIVYAVLLLYTPLPIFWSLFDQQGSRWTFQASRMDGNVMGIQIVPDQMQVINPAIVLLLIPFFDRVLYPLFTKFEVLENPLHRMAVGGIIAGLAFLSAGVLEMTLERTYPELPEQGETTLNFINTLPCDLNIHNPYGHPKLISASEFIRFYDVPVNKTSRHQFIVRGPHTCGNIEFSSRILNTSITAIEYQVDTILIGVNDRDEVETYTTDPIDFMKSLSGKPRLRIAFLKSSTQLHNVTVTLQNTAGFQDIYFVHDSLELAASAYMDLPQGVYECIVSSNEKEKLHSSYIQLGLGGIYTLVLRERRNAIEFSKLFTMSPPNSVNILWLIPQYFLISVAEIMFGIAGLEFSFTQAPKCLKTVTIAAWYLSVALGNLLVIMITQAKFFKSQAYEFFLFAVLIVADMMVFTHMASKYSFVDLEADSSACIMKDDTMAASAL